MDMIWFYCFTLAFFLKYTSAADTIFPNQTLQEGDTLVSASKIFELGFFRLGNSSLGYLGIWYNIIPVRTVVWVANRELPVVDPTGILKVNDYGDLQLLSISNTLIWSSQSSRNEITPVAQLLDTGNLVIRDDMSGDLIWQSFDNPGDTWLPGMKIGLDLVTGINRHLTSWKSPENPSSGSYTVLMDTKGYPQLYSMEHESTFRQRVGSWNGLGFTGMRLLGTNRVYAFEFVSSREEIYVVWGPAHIWVQPLFPFPCFWAVNKERRYIYREACKEVEQEKIREKKKFECVYFFIAVRHFRRSPEIQPLDVAEILTACSEHTERHSDRSVFQSELWIVCYRCWFEAAFSGCRILLLLFFRCPTIYCRYVLANASIPIRMTLDEAGDLRMSVWVDRSRQWKIYMSTMRDLCDVYGLCGSYGGCNINKSPVCECLQGFEPKLPEEWTVAKWSNGCKHEMFATRTNGSNFRKFSNLKLPDTRGSWFNTTMSLGECLNLCVHNISCTAFANTDIREGGSGCLLWFSELIDIREASEGDESRQNIYIKMSSPNLSRDKKKKKKKFHLKLTLSIVLAVALLSFAVMLYGWRKKKSQHKFNAFKDKEGKQELELPLFSLNKIVKATGSFSINNKLGQGGFGAVYKGVLEDGGEIAVKRLSETSRQGVTEFQNEVICIAKLQHRNLVKLLGCCVQGEEMMLIYEYMPNKSLDFFLFGWIPQSYIRTLA